MNRTRLFSLATSRQAAQALLVLGIFLAAIWWWRMPPAPDQTSHRHMPGEHGGIILPVGQEHHHVEALLAEGGILKLFTLGQDQSLVVAVPMQQLTAYVRTAESIEAVPIVLEPAPQPGDPPDQTSAFEGQVPLELVGSQIIVTVPSITIGQKRYRFAFLTDDPHKPAMPRKVTDEAERTLYLTPGGKYTAADIKANGSLTASQKYRGFRSAHDMHPATGDVICPITETKANPKCTWIVNGKRYAFCCPPCIDEFVKLAKEHGEQIKEPAAYAQK